MRALITGGTGFVGPHLCDLLLRNGDDVSVLSLGSNHGLPASVKFFEVDIRDAAEVQGVVEEVQPTAVYHLSAVASISSSATNPRLAFEVNVGGTYNLFEAALRLAKPPRILNISTSQVYGGYCASMAGAGERIREDAPVLPLNPYAASKAMAEQVPALFPGADYVTVRPFNHSGPGQTTEFVLSSLAAQVEEIEAGVRPPRLTLGDVEVQRDFLDVRDVVRAYRLLVECGHRGEVYNVASGVARSIGSILQSLKSLVSVKFEIHVDESLRRPGQPRCICGDPAKMFAHTGWQPCIAIEQMLRDLLDYWRAKRGRARHG